MEVVPLNQGDMHDFLIYSEKGVFFAAHLKTHHLVKRECHLLMIFKLSKIIYKSDKKKFSFLTGL